MFGAILRAAKEVFTSVFGLAGTVASAVGILKQFGYFPNVPVETWVLWVIAITALFVSAIRLQYRLDEAQAQTAIPVPDLTLLKLARQIIGSDVLFQQGNAGKTGMALLSIREAALQGRIQVWGRKNVGSSDVLAVYPLQPIDRAYWEDAELDYLGFMGDQRGGAAGKRDLSVLKAMPPKFYDLHFNQRQANAVWPKPKRRFKFCLH
jgi:hypothetical protein